MKRATTAFAMLTATVLTFAACGDDDDNNGGGGAGSGNTSGSAGTSSTSPGDGGSGGIPTLPGEGGAPPTSGNVPCDPEQATTCQNDTDCPFVVDGTARGTAQACGREECLASSDEDCARDCILAQLEMTSDCASCYADSVKCAIENCLLDCVSDPNSEGCLGCQVEAGCRPTFDECSGLGQ